MKSLLGLTAVQAREKLEKDGENNLPEKKQTSDLRIIFRQIKSPLIYILLFAAGVSLFLREFSDALIILLAVVINTVLGFYQERKAEQSLAALKNILSPRAKVLRDGEIQEINARYMVVGDVAIVGAGDTIPADGVVIEASNLFVSEAILTGESVSVGKMPIAHASIDPVKIVKESISNNHQVYMGTTITTGVGRILITKTGMHTRLGGIAHTLSTTKEEETPLQKRLSRFARFLTIVVGVASLVLFATGVATGREAGEMFTTSVAIAVAAIPEGMVVALTVILALGMQRVLKKKALVRKLVAVETLGSVTVIATDKTGTLTNGILQVVKISTKHTACTEKCAVLANNLLDPLEIALWEWAEKKKLHPQKMRNHTKPIQILPFDPQIKLSATEYESDIYVLGAPEVVLEKSTVGKKQQADITQQVEEWGKKGLRMIALGYKKRGKHDKKISLERLKDIEWVGLVGFEDPVRRTVKTALHDAQSAGMEVKIITGDYRHTAEAVLAQIGMPIKHPKEQVLDGGQIEQLSDEELRRRAGSVVLFSRVTPDQKFRIVQALKENNEVVALLGDGVNDAPALKKADIGIVVASASDVARETANMVLLDSNFQTIIDAIEEGRGIFDNLRKVILYLISDSFSEMIIIFSSIALGIPLPLTVAQILWVNIVDDGLPSLALTVEPKEPGLLKRAPISHTTPLVDTEMKVLVAIISTVSGVVCVATFLYAWSVTSDIMFAQTVTFVVLGVNTLLYVFSVRNLHKPLWLVNPFSNKYLVMAVVIGFVLQIIALYVPFIRSILGTEAISLYWWGVVLGGSLVVIVAIEIVKMLFYSMQTDN